MIYTHKTHVRSQHKENNNDYTERAIHNTTFCDATRDLRQSRQENARRKVPVAEVEESSTFCDVRHAAGCHRVQFSRRFRTGAHGVRRITLQQYSASSTVVRDKPCTCAEISDSTSWFDHPLVHCMPGVCGQNGERRKKILR